jgi:putative transcriptional regulator
LVQQGVPMDETALKAFGGRLKAMRTGAGLTQQQLADRAGLSLRAVTQWERGVREPSWGNVLALASALGVDCTAFTQPPSPEQPPIRPGRPRKAAEPGQAEPPQPAAKGKRKGKEG